MKQRLKEAVELPFQEPEALARLGVVPPRGERVHDERVGCVQVSTAATHMLLSRHAKNMFRQPLNP